MTDQMVRFAETVSREPRNDGRMFTTDSLLGCARNEVESIIPMIKLPSAPLVSALYQTRIGRDVARNRFTIGPFSPANKSGSRCHHSFRRRSGSAATIT